VTSAVYYLSTVGWAQSGGTEMAQTVEDLAQCIAAANGNRGKVRQCQKDFVAAGGTEGTPEGGKVFSDTTGGNVFVTDGGKVFDGKR
jgi:hypothetical protein